MAAATASTARPRPAGVHRRRAARARGLFSRIPRPDSRGLHPRPAPVHKLVPRSVAAAVPGPPRRHRDLRPGTGDARAGPRDRHPPPVHHCRVLQVRRRRGTPRPLARRARPPAKARLRVARHRPGPQRGRRPPGRCGARAAGRARADLPARAQWPSGLRGHWHGHRAPGPRARPPDPGHHPQGRQGRHHPARPAHRPRHRPGHRRTHGRPAVPSRRWETAGSARRRADRPPRHPPRRDHQAGQPAHAAARVHHRRPRRRSPAPRRAGSRLSRRPAYHHALRPGPHQPRPPRQLHSRHLHRRSREIAPRTGLAANRGQTSRSLDLRPCDCPA